MPVGDGPAVPALPYPVWFLSCYIVFDSVSFQEFFILAFSHLRFRHSGLID